MANSRTQRRTGRTGPNLDRDKHPYGMEPEPWSELQAIAPQPVEASAAKSPQIFHLHNLFSLSQSDGALCAAASQLKGSAFVPGPNRGPRLPVADPCDIWKGSSDEFAQPDVYAASRGACVISLTFTCTFTGTFTCPHAIGVERAQMPQRQGGARKAPAADEALACLAPSKRLRPNTRRTSRRASRRAVNAAALRGGQSIRIVPELDLVVIVTAGYYEDYTPRAFGIQCGLFGDVLQAVTRNPPFSHYGGLRLRLIRRVRMTAIHAKFFKPSNLFSVRLEPANFSVADWGILCAFCRRTRSARDSRRAFSPAISSDAPCCSLFLSCSS
jgi:hypothetical protein